MYLGLGALGVQQTYQLVDLIKDQYQSSQRKAEEEITADQQENNARQKSPKKSRSQVGGRTIPGRKDRSHLGSRLNRSSIEYRPITRGRK